MKRRHSVAVMPSSDRKSKREQIESGERGRTYFFICFSCFVLKSKFSRIINSVCAINPIYEFYLYIKIVELLPKSKLIYAPS